MREQCAFVRPVVVHRDAYKVNYTSLSKDYEAGGPAKYNVA